MNHKKELLWSLWVHTSCASGHTETSERLTETCVGSWVLPLPSTLNHYVPQRV